MAKDTRNNTVTLTYNIQHVTKKTDYKEARDRIKEATGLSNKEVADIIAPAYGEFYNWLNLRRKALLAYEEVLTSQVLRVLNGGSVLVAAANAQSEDGAGNVPPAGSPEMGVSKQESKDIHTANTNNANVARKTLERYQSDHSLSNAALARMLGVSSNTVVNWVTGKTTPTPNNVNTIVAWLKSQGYEVATE